MTPGSCETKLKNSDSEPKPKKESCASSVAHDDASCDALMPEDACSPTENRFMEDLGSLPDELRARVAQCLALSDVAAVSASCSNLQETFWKSCSVWQMSGIRYGVYEFENLTCASTCQEAVRLATWRPNFKSMNDLAIEVWKHSPGDPAAPTGSLFAEATYLFHKLLPRDGATAVKVCELLMPALRSHTMEAAVAAQKLFKAARQSSLPKDALEDLEDAYGHGLLQQDLLESCMQDHEGMLEAQFSELEVALERQSNIQLDFDLEDLIAKQSDTHA